MILLRKKTTRHCQRELAEIKLQLSHRDQDPLCLTLYNITIGFLQIIENGDMDLYLTAIRYFTNTAHVLGLLSHTKIGVVRAKEIELYYYVLEYLTDYDCLHVLHSMMYAETHVPRKYEHVHELLRVLIQMCRGIALTNHEFASCIDRIICIPFYSLYFLKQRCVTAGPPAIKMSTRSSTKRRKRSRSTASQTLD